MISVKESASCGATRCHITWVSEKPCSSSSGGPLPPTRAKIRPDAVLIHSEAKPGKRSARSMVVLLRHNGGELQFDAYPSRACHEAQSVRPSGSMRFVCRPE